MAKARKVTVVPKGQRTTLTNLRQRWKPEHRGGGRKSDIDTLIASWRDVTRRALEFIDDPALAAATAKELADVASKGTQNIQLLKGLPTKILGVAERASMEDVLKLALQEAHRRELVELPRGGYKDITPKN